MRCGSSHLAVPGLAHRWLGHFARQTSIVIRVRGATKDPTVERLVIIIGAAGRFEQSVVELLVVSAQRTPVVLVYHFCHLLFTAHTNRFLVGAATLSR